MSSLNDVIVMPFATFGSATNVPEPRRRVSRPSRTSSSRAARRVNLEIPSAWLSTRSDGIASPTLEGLDQLEHLLAGFALLRHRRAPRARRGSGTSRRPVSAWKNCKRRGSTASETRSPTAAAVRRPTRAVKREPPSVGARSSSSASRISAVIERASTREEDVGVRAEVLEHLDDDVERRQLGSERGVLEALRTDAEDHGAVGRAQIGPAREGCTGRTRHGRPRRSPRRGSSPASR